MFGKEVPITPSEYNYYKMWIFANKLHIKPYELDLISEEDKNVLWNMLLYADKKDEHDSFMNNSRSKDK